MSRHKTFVVAYRDPKTGGERTAYVDAADWTDAERQLDLIGSGQVDGELLDTGWADGPPQPFGRA